MLKHVQLSPYRQRNHDSISLSSSVSYSSLSRSSSYSSLNETTAVICTIKVYAKCLRSDIEYKTLGITYQTTSREVVNSLLNKYRMRHRDPNLFYLTMEVTVRKAGIRTVIVLDDESRPAVLQSCHPRGDSRFSLQIRHGGLVKIYDSVLMPGSKYKSLLISEHTTVDELIQILLNCYSSKERVEQFSLYEVCESQEYQRKLHPDDCPLQVQRVWAENQGFHYLLRLNLDYRFRRTKVPWTAGSPSLPCTSRQSIAQTETVATYPDYQNYFYI